MKRPQNSGVNIKEKATISAPPGVRKSLIPIQPSMQNKRMDKKSGIFSLTIPNLLDLQILPGMTVAREDPFI